MKDNWKYNNNYKIDKEKYYYNIDNDYIRPKSYYKSYGTINSNQLNLGLSDKEITEIMTYLSIMSNSQYKRLSDAITNAQNLGISLSYRDILILIKTIISNDTRKRTSSVSVSKQKETEEEKKKREEQERIKQEQLEKERQEREEKARLERERIAREKEARAKQIVDKFMSDITSKQVNGSFRGWVLPNGLLISQYNETTEAYMNNSPRRQDHSSLVKTFMSGLEEYDKNQYDRIQSLYNEYLSFNGLTSGDIDESFAVERLGWMQVSVCGQKIIAYRAERWQDRILRPFFMDHGFKYIVQDRGRSYEFEFADLYNHMDEILELGLRKRYQRVLR